MTDGNEDFTEFKVTDSEVQQVFAGKAAARKLAGASSPLPRHGDGERFVKGPIPMKWLTIASACGQRAEAVSLLLWYAAGLTGSNPVKLTPHVLSELTVHPKTGRRVLERMQKAGLVDVEFHRGRAPLVTILPHQERDKDG